MNKMIYLKKKKFEGKANLLAIKNPILIEGINNLQWTRGEQNYDLRLDHVFYGKGERGDVE